MDFSALKELRLHGNEFSMDHLKVVADHVPINTNPVTRLKFCIDSQLIDKKSDEWISQIVRLRGKVPNVEVRISNPAYLDLNSGTILIPSWLDKKTGERIVLWRDIQNEVGDAHRVRNGKRSVTFMMDEDFNELHPKRIRYNPGVVLDVVVANQGQEATVAPKSSMPSGTLIQGSTSSLQSVCPKDPVHRAGRDGKINSVVQHVSKLSIAHLDAINRSLNAQSAILDNEEQTPLQQGDLSNGTLGTTNIMQNIQIPTVDDYIKELIGGIRTAGIQEGDLFQVHTLHLLQKMLDKQQQTLNRQVLLENRVQAMMTQNYELHEYPIPRLFIVLPKPKKRKDKLTHPLTKQFRLYFLCECGEHTKGASRGHLPNKIHLAKHEGYDLDQPNEFFKRYGSYVLAIMKFLKYGTLAASVAIPPLALFKVIEGLDAIQKSLMMTTDAIRSLIDQTIKHIQNLQGNTLDDGSAPTGPMRLEDIEALEGADLRQLQLFLNDKDKGRVLGDLFRVYTPDGHVKWVCIDHYKENYREAAMQRFREIVSANGGDWTAEDAVRIHLESNTAATQFYEAMVKARGIQSLVITLQWDVKMDDLRRLSSAITRTNIYRLELLVRSEGPVRDIINKGRRYNPVLELMCNGRIQEMELLLPSNEFYRGIDISSMATTSQLQKLSLPLYTRSYRSTLVRLLKCSPCLIELELRVSDFNEAFEDITTDLTTLPCLKKLVMHLRIRRIEVEFSQCRIQSMDGILQTDCIWEQPQHGVESLSRKGHFTELTTGSTSVHHVPQLVEMMQWNPRLRYIQLDCSMEDSQTIMDAITSTRERIMSEQGYFGPLRVKLPFDCITVEFEFRNESTTTTTLSREGMRQPKLASARKLSPLLLKYGQWISALKTQDEFNDELTTILDRVTDIRGSRITSLQLDTFPLTNVGLESMMRVIERSQNVRLDIKFKEMETRHQQKKVDLFLRRCGKRLHGLKMEGNSADVWVPMVMDLCPTRLYLPELESFSLLIHEDTRLPPDCIEWIASMVSSPQEQPTCSLEPFIQSTMSSTLGTSADEWSPLRSIELKNVSPQVIDWELVIGSIDYSVLRTLRIEDGFSCSDAKLLRSRIPVKPNPVTELDLKIEPSNSFWYPILFGSNPPLLTESNFSSTVARMQQLLETA
ncbi:hypothetical protein BGX34_002659 [Mortierella sp. NVP85]|nr:hypothetical protein BGX34_002659 [Mortierella sp. NVP85]